MRVVAALPMYPPVSRVGAWAATHQFLRHMVSRGHKVSVHSSLYLGHPYTVDGVAVEAGYRSRLLDDARGADLVVFHAGDDGTGQAAAAVAGRSVCMVHGTAMPPPADLVVYNSQASADALPTSAPSIVCHPPTDPAEHATTPGDRVTLVNLSRNKGVMCAWRTSEILTGTPFLGVRGGYGEQTPPRGTNWEIIDTQADMREVWSRTRVLLCPSAIETWGMVGVEAMCSGIPVIAHPTPGLTESLGAAGIFADRHDPQAWADEIVRLADTRTWRAASRKAKARAEELWGMGHLDLFADTVEGLTR